MVGGAGDGMTGSPVAPFERLKLSFFPCWKTNVRQHAFWWLPKMTVVVWPAT